MNALAAEVAQAVTATAAPHDPLLVGLAWIAAIVVAIVTIGKPIRDYLRDEKKNDASDKVDGAKSDAEETLYKHLSEQVREQRDIANKAYEERNDLLQRVAVLEARTKDLETMRELVATLKQRLEEKDTQIAKLVADAAEERRRFLDIMQVKDKEIANRDARILVLERGQRDLELRLVRDEVRMGLQYCPLHQQQLKDEVAEETPQMEMHYGTQAES